MVLLKIRKVLRLHFQKKVHEILLEDMSFSETCTESITPVEQLPQVKAYGEVLQISLDPVQMEWSVHVPSILSFGSRSIYSKASFPQLDKLIAVRILISVLWESSDVTPQCLVNQWGSAHF